MSRRSFLKVGALGATGLGLGDLLRLRAAEGSPRKTSIILVWLVGGQSQIDTYDLKPKAPAEYRGLFQPIRTNVPGMDICELLPRQARIADKFTLIRSISHKYAGHVDGAQMFLSGHAPKTINPTTTETDNPDISCVYKALTPPNRNGLPTSVGVRHELYYVGPSFLGLKNSQFVIPSHSIHQSTSGPPDYRVPNLEIRPEAMSRFSDRLALKKSFDRLRRDIDAKGAMAAMDSFDQEAVHLITGPDARRAFDLEREEPRVRDRYGRCTVGQGLLLARRLVEAGVGFVSVDGGLFQDVHPTLADNWDDHETNRNIFDAGKRRLPAYDQCVSTLIEDIHERGLDRDVLVVVTGEFGREPKVRVAPDGTPGRGHYPAAMTVLVSGGGMRMGQVIGETDARAEAPRSRLLSPADFLTTLYDYLGIDSKRDLKDREGRPVPILPGGEAIRELLS
jgi:uncharacterized protein (DUF1501 family)